MDLAFIIDIGLATVGFILGRKKNSSFVAYAVNLLNYFLYYTILPMVIFMAVLNAPSIGFYMLSVLLSILHICLLMVSSFLLSRIVSNDVKDRMAITTASSLPNAGYLAIPLAMIILGTERYVTPYAVAFNIVLSLTSLLIAVKVSRESPLNAVKSLPPILAVMVSIILKQHTIGLGSALDVLSTFTLHAIRSSFLVIGYGLTNLTYSSLKSLVKPLLVVALLKIPYSLLVAKAILSFIVLPREFIRGFMLQSIMPPAINNIIIAKMFKLNEDLVAASIAIITPVSVLLSLALFSLPLW
ncbi:MAG: hypothetical protein N3D82_00715 [Ignisphaera sp.]|nr:hypothetical protein [Ignisphaera sp.]MCX8167536.1 hypothetical protein [Ignisphaera sp.]MDW8086012.1 hypothetical protein [Ignisphaera sp.]